MSERRQVWETIARLLQRVEKSIADTPPVASEPSNLEQEIRRMGKTQHKANLFAEEQNAQVKQALALAQSAQQQNVRLLDSLSAEHAASTQKDTLEAILPALDGLEHAIALSENPRPGCQQSEPDPAAGYTGFAG
jgi:ATP-dependent exoDNAse (exonuclease V) alpha subunit